MNVVIYARYSSHNQTEQSIEGQLKECYAYAERNNYNVVAEYIDRATSGTNDNRPEFRKMIEDSNSRHFNGVLVYQFDRFARNRYDSATYKHKLKKNLVRVFSVRENISEDASGVLMESMLEGMAEYYSAELSQKVKRGMSINASKFLFNGGSVPLGFRIDSEKHYQIDDTTAPTIYKIFTKYVNGSSMAEITRYLNESQIKTSYGNDFNKNSLHNILLNRRYAGSYIYNNEEYKNAIPKIIDDKLFSKAQEVMAKNKLAPARSRAKADYLLTTKLFCGECKEMMVGVSGTSHMGSVHNYYQCKKSRLKSCPSKSVKKVFVEDLVVNTARTVLNDKNIESIADAVVGLAKKESLSSNLKQISKLIKNTKKQRANLFDSLKICDVKSVKVSLFEEISKIDLQLKQLESDLALEESSHIKVTSSQIKFFLTKIRSGDVNDEHHRKTLINVLVNKVYLYSDKVIIYFNTQDGQVTVNTPRTPDISKVEGSFMAQDGQPDWT